MELTHNEIIEIIDEINKLFDKIDANGLQRIAVLEFMKYRIFVDCSYSKKENNLIKSIGLN